MTKIMRRALIGASTLAFVTLAATPAAAQRVERIVAMGDSLADTGNALQLLLASPLVPPATKAQLLQLYPSGRFSGGTNYIDSLSLLLNAPVINYAVGGAQTGALNQFAGLPGFTQETMIFLSGTTPPGTIFPPNGGFQEGDLLALSIGVNDGRAFYQTNPGGTIAQAQAAALVSVTNATNNLNLLVGAGAPTISYVALNAGLTPDVQGTPSLAALGNAFSTTFNTNFQTTLAGYAANGVMVHYLDGATVLANVAANPAAYGIANLFCPPIPSPTCIINSSGYLFYADGIHPTSDGMRIIAQYVATQLQAPLTFQATSDLALDTARQFGRTLTSRANFASAGAAGIQPFLVGDTFSRDVDTSDSTDPFDIDGVGLTGGVSFGFAGAAVGIAANYSRPKAKFLADIADTRTETWQVGAFAGTTIGGVVAQGYVGYGKDDHEIERGGVIDNLNAEADGSHWLAGVKAGYLVPMGDIRVGPMVALDYAKAKVDGYTEEGDAALTLDVDSVSARSLTGSLGVELRGQLDTGGIALRPFAAAAIEKDLIGDGRTVRFSQTSAPVIVNSWDLEDRSKKAYARLTGGAAASILEGVSLDALVSATMGRDDGNEVSGHLGLSFGF
jgi:outer membrane lipase/esterase